jgi:hypothetical protein
VTAARAGADFASRVIDECVTALAGESLTLLERIQVVSILRAAGPLATLDERRTSDVMTVLARRRAEPAVVRGLLRTLEICNAPEKLVRALDRLGCAMQDDGAWQSIFELAGIVTSVSAWRAALQPTWLEYALTFAPDDRALEAAANLIDPWMGVLPTSVHPALECVLARHPELLLELSAEKAWRVQRLLPTRPGWRLLADKASTFGGPPPPEVFGPNLARALARLDEAIAEEPEGAVRTTLASWSIELRE